MNTHEWLSDMEWLSQLAHRLVRDPALADDAVQEAWLAARGRLQSNGETKTPDRNLLGRTLRGVLMHAWRGERRRAFHEKKAARAEALPSVEELLEIGERQQSLWRHLSRLEEPFRRTLLLRFQQSLSTRELAARLGEKEDTIRWRIRRGLELLRDTIEREEGGAGLMGLVPVAALAAAPSKAAGVVTGAVTGAAASGGAFHLVPAGAVWMMSKGVLGAVVTVLLLMAALRFTGDDPIGPATDVVATPGAVGEAGPDPLDPPSVSPIKSGAQAREAATALADSRSSAPDAAIEGGAPQEALIAGRLLDRLQAPIVGARVTASQGKVWERACESDGEGRFELRCPREPDRRINVVVWPMESHGHARLALGHGGSCDFPPLDVDRVDVGDLVVPACGVLTGRVVDGLGEPISGAFVSANMFWFKAVTDAAGVFTLAGPDLGSNYLRVHADRYVDFGRSIHLEERKVLDVGTLVLEELGNVSVSGVVVDQLGNGVSGASVYSKDDSVETGPGGSFAGTFACDETVLLNASAEGFRVANTKKCRDGAEVRFVLLASGPSRVFEVLDAATRAPVAGAEIRLSLQPDSALEPLVYGGMRWALEPGTERRRTGMDGRGTACAEAAHDSLAVSAPGYQSTTLDPSPDEEAGDPQVILLRRQPRAVVTGKVPAAFASGLGEEGRPVTVEVQVLERFVSDLGEGTPIWEGAAPASEGVTEGKDWLKGCAALRVKSRHLVHSLPDRSFSYVHSERAMVRGVVRGPGRQVYVSDPACLRVSEPVELGGWSSVETGGLVGELALPHPRLSSGFQLSLEGVPGELFVGADGSFRVSGLIPGPYCLEPLRVPDGVDREAIRSVVHVESGEATYTVIDPRLGPYGEVELTLLVNGQRPSQGFGVRLRKGGEEYVDYFEYRDGEPFRMLVPAADDYVVTVEPLDGTSDNVTHQIAQRISVPAGESRLDLDIESCTVTCALGPRYFDRLEDTWQLLEFSGPKGEPRAPVDAAQHVVFSTHPGADYPYIDVTFRYVPTDATHFHFVWLGRGEERIRLPFEADLSSGAAVRVVLE